jgi:hypothetical protein
MQSLAHDLGLLVAQFRTEQTGGFPRCAGVRSTPPPAIFFRQWIIRDCRS